jgi:hypothetical protein
MLKEPHQIVFICLRFTSFRKHNPRMLEPMARAPLSRQHETEFDATRVHSS